MEIFTPKSEPSRLSNSHQSKGNQIKWKEQGCWYKADCFGYEALSEIVVSRFLDKSNLMREEYVSYRPVTIRYNGMSIYGCVSDSFLPNECDLITIERYHRAYTTFSLASTLGSIGEVAKRIEYAVDFFTRTTDNPQFGQWITKMLEVDTLFFNEDRHTNNISLICNENGDISLSPIYDNGAALFSDTSLSFPISKSYENCLASFRAKPFSENADEQLDVLEAKFGSLLHFDMTKSEAKSYFNRIVEREMLDSVYPDEVLNRVEETLRQQIRKYAYMFSQ